MGDDEPVEQGSVIEQSASLRCGGYSPQSLDDLGFRRHCERSEAIQPLLRLWIAAPLCSSQ